MKQCRKYGVVFAVSALLSLAVSPAIAGQLVIPGEQKFLDDCITTVHDLYEEEHGERLKEETPSVKVLIFSHVLRGCVFMYGNQTLDFNQYLWATCVATEECLPKLTDVVPVFIDMYYCDVCVEELLPTDEPAVPPNSKFRL